MLLTVAGIFIVVRSSVSMNAPVPRVEILLFSSNSTLSRELQL